MIVEPAKSCSSISRAEGSGDEIRGASSRRSFSLGCCFGALPFSPPALDFLMASNTLPINFTSQIRISKFEIRNSNFLILLIRGGSTGRP
jgi:hypothetical protein